MEVNRTSIK